MTTKIKICGLTTPDTLDVALEGGADFVGAVVFPKSPRHLEPEAAAALFERALPGRPVHLIVGMLANKDPAGLLAPFAQADFLHAVPVADHEHHPPAELAETARALGVTAAPVSSVSAALDVIADRGRATVLILGSLYLAGEVLRGNGELPD